ncbi:MAG: non-heme iron oxygenase ferredoxin subunit [Halofilum sp. (in: g-proteobacteria)]|nr:non-heme iron oxygenase ferredoxin subunit [Halofilum sp. (in: g-proteobacteria)]
MADWVDVASKDELPPGEHRVVDVDDVEIAVFNVDGEFYAIEDVCTHDGGQLTGGEIEHDCVVCPRHGAKFCIKTGEALTPPAYEPTETFPVRVTDEGMIQVCDPRWD